MFRKKLRYWLPVVVWAGVIFSLSSIPNLSTNLGTIDLVLRKLAHLTEYAALTLLLLRALINTTGFSWRKSQIYSLSGAAFYAVSDELHQSFVPTRGPSVFDVGIDCLGVILALGLSVWWRKKKTGFICLLLCFFLSGCGVDYTWRKADKLEKEKNYSAAITAYRKIITKYSSSPYLPESYYRIARIWQLQERLVQARENYQVLIGSFPASDWGLRAREEITACYDYFPLVEGNYWLDVDSESGGKYYRAEIKCGKKQGKEFKLISRIFAGEKLVGKQEVIYQKSKDGLSMSNSPGKTFFQTIAAPIKNGESWVSTLDGEKIRLTIISCREKVKVRAGQFDDCLKIKQQPLDYPSSWRFDYYAPQVGRILVTQAGNTGKQETRSTELLKYQLKSE
ncbi:MAG: VanZ family protein [Elusimicrobiota bacterium]